MANIQETKVLLGGLDKDNSIESIDRYDYLDAHNIRTIGIEGSDANYTTNLEGTELITDNLPLGQNRGVGGARFETVGKAYRIIYNSNGYHQIREFDFHDKKDIVIFENLTDTGNVDIFPITANDFFCDVRLMHERFLILNNGVNPIYFFNIEYFKDNRGDWNITQDDILLSKKPPLFPPTFTYINNSARVTNNLKGNLFQFRHQFEYEDFRDSSWGTISKRIVPINEPSDGYGQTVSLYNGLIVNINLGSDRVENVNVAVRIGEGNWLLVKTVSLRHIKSLTTGSIPTNAQGDVTNPLITEAYNPTTNTYQFVFYNDGLYPVLDPVEVGNPYDFTPEKAETVEVINGNILAIGGLTEGKDRPELDEFKLSVSSYYPNIANSITGGGDFDTNGYTESVHVYGSTDSGLEFKLYFKGSPKAGDIITIETKAYDGSLTKNTYTYTVTNADQLGGLPAVYKSLAGILPESAYQTDYVRFRTGRNVGDNIKSFRVQRSDIGTVVSKSINSLKTNSSYQLAVAYIDDFGKYFPIVTDERFIAKTPSLSEGQGNLPEINWQIQEKAPEGASSYQILMSENLTHEKSIYVTGSYDAALSTTSYLAFNVKSLERFYRNEKESQVNYSFTKGDKVTLVYTSNGINSTPIKWFRYPFIDLDIVDFSVEDDATDPNKVNYTLKVRNSSVISLADLSDVEILMELYTPKKRELTGADGESASLLFYEIGEAYPIVNGKHTKLTGVIREGDWFYKGRLYESTIAGQENTALTYLVEDPNFSDNYISNFWSAGRPRFYDDEVGRVFKRASIRYSDEYVYGTKYNGVGRFYLERIYGEQGGQTTSKYGAIKRLEMRDSALVCIQEFKVGLIPVYKSIIFDNANTSLVADSGKIFGSVQYRIGNYGCGSAKESIVVSRDSIIYFIDDNNCVPIRDSYSGLDVIDVNMTHYFIEHIRKAKAQQSKLIGYFDDLNREYNVTTEDKRSTVDTLNFSDATYKDSLVQDLNQISDLTADNGTVSLSGSNLIYTPTTDYLGEDYITFNYYGQFRRVGINVVAGSLVPDDFTFVSKLNQQLNTLVQSDLISIGGLTMSSPISIVGGEFSINDEPWSSAATTIPPESSLRVRVLSSTERDTETSTTVTIGGKSTTFTVKTIPEDVEPNGYLDVTGTVYNQGDNVWGVRVNISEQLNEAYSISFTVQYKKFGSVQVTSPIKIVIADSTNTNNIENVVVAPDSVENGEFILNTSQPVADKGTILCKDGKIRILRITRRMFVDIN